MFQSSFGSLFDHGSLQVKCETTKWCAKTGSISLLFVHFLITDLFRLSAKLMFQNRVRFNTFCSLFDHGSLQVKCETTKRCSKTGPTSILFDHGSLQVKCETTKRCSKTWSRGINFGIFGQNTNCLRHVPPPYPPRKSMVRSVTNNRQTCDEHRFLDPSYTIAPKGAINRLTQSSKTVIVLTLEYSENYFELYKL